MDQGNLDEMYRLVKENNRMLHGMRRSALFGRLVTIIVWAIFLGVPIWAYFTYLAPLMQNMLNTLNRMQGGNGVQINLKDPSAMFKELESRFGSSSQAAH